GGGGPPAALPADARPAEHPRPMPVSARPALAGSLRGVPVGEHGGDHVALCCDLQRERRGGRAAAGPGRRARGVRLGRRGLGARAAGGGVPRCVLGVAGPVRRGGGAAGRGAPPAHRAAHAHRLRPRLHLHHGADGGARAGRRALPARPRAPPPHGRGAAAAVPGGLRARVRHLRVLPDVPAGRAAAAGGDGRAPAAGQRGLCAGALGHLRLLPGPRAGLRPLLRQRHPGRGHAELEGLHRGARAGLGLRPRRLLPGAPLPRGLRHGRLPAQRRVPRRRPARPALR
ncbi:unnamed protein product, partial [Heterosigma akashiwo]